LTSLTYIDAEPSWRITMSAPALRMMVTRACGRERAMMQNADASMSDNQNARSPAHV
jgi:hypothetical protein